MRPLFPPWTNQLVWLGMFIGLATIVSIPLLLMAWVRTPYVTGEGNAPDQPIQFDHRHHVGDDGVDCLYCHADAERGPYAGVPSTATCMGCHAQMWNDSPLLVPLRRAYFTGAPVQWTRVTRLPDFVYFNHQAHVSHGVGCVSCHGRVDQMAMTYTVKSFQMGWCIGCHREPDVFLRPLAEITNMHWTPSESRNAIGARIRRELSVNPTTDCSTCHR